MFKYLRPSSLLSVVLGTNCQSNAQRVDKSKIWHHGTPQRLPQTCILPPVQTQESGAGKSDREASLRVSGADLLCNWPLFVQWLPRVCDFTFHGLRYLWSFTVQKYYMKISRNKHVLNHITFWVAGWNLEPPFPATPDMSRHPFVQRLRTVHAPCLLISQSPPGWSHPLSCGTIVLVLQ